MDVGSTEGVLSSHDQVCCMKRTRRVVRVSLPNYHNQHQYSGALVRVPPSLSYLPCCSRVPLEATDYHSG